MKFFWFLTFHRKPNVWQNPCSGIIPQNVVSQSDCVCKKNRGIKLTFCTKINIDVFLQAGIFVFTGHSNACPKHSHIYAVSQKRREGWSWFFACRWTSDHPTRCGHCQAWPNQITQNNKFAKYLQYLEKEVKDKVDFLCRCYPSQLSINWYYHFWWVWSGMPKVLKITRMQCLSNISKKNWVMKVMFCMMINMKVFYKLTVFIYLFFFDGFGQTCPNDLGRFVISLWHFKKEVRKDVRDNYTCWFKSYPYRLLYIHGSPTIGPCPQYGIHTKPLLYMINCLCNISSLLFYVTLGPCKLACFSLLGHVIYATLWGNVQFL